ncbi:class I SAM-dependent methyltransferase [Terrarubrum flagellatum]|uniref:class I SAM-dependent methyltransferase n=1 Tax=Terrirubrum flagellatum TaxID=2895980 RepID=UPI0031454816
MTQNVYDDGTFFAGYSQLGRSVSGLDGAAEWPALRALLPDLGGLRVLDLGCGFGWFCRYAREQGAASVLGVDVSENMLARAVAETKDDAIRYEHADLENFAPPESSFDLIYSSLALHYVVGLEALLARIHSALAPGGRFIFSAEHPIYTAPREPRWIEDSDGRKSWPVDQYLVEGPRERDWLGASVVKQHRLIGTYVTLLLKAGLTIAHLEEWRPSEAQIAARPELGEELERPMFFLISARG